MYWKINHQFIIITFIRVYQTPWYLDLNAFIQSFTVLMLQKDGYVLSKKKKKRRKKLALEIRMRKKEKGT